MTIIDKKITDIHEYANNPRHNENAVEAVANSIRSFGFKVPIVIDKNNVIVAGHTRKRAAESLGLETVPCIVADDLTEEQIKAFRVADNKTAELAEWDFDKLESELVDLASMGFEMDDFGFDNFENDNTVNNEIDDYNSDEESNQTEKNEEAEKLLNEAYKLYAKDFVTQYEILKSNGFTFSGLSKHYAQFCFLQTKYYGKKYPRYLSLCFHPQQFITSGDLCSAYEGLQKVVDGSIKTERLRFITGDGRIDKIIGGSLAFSGARMPLDFPVELAKSLIAEFANKGNVLDPCHGWGGRLIGALLNDVESYTGVDPSPLQNEGVNEIYNTFKDYTSTKKVRIINSPFEKANIEKEYFDFALTSPPYFDVEQYIGGEQSYNYGNYEAWKENFYVPLIKKTFDALKHGAFFALQVGSQSYPLFEDGKKIALNVGFDFVEKRTTEMTNSQTQTDEEHMESIMILRKK